MSDIRFFFVSVVESGKHEEPLFKQHHISATQALAMSDWLLDVDARVMDAIKLAKQRGFVATGDAVVVVTGWVGSPQSLTPTLHPLPSSVRAMARQTPCVSSTPIKHLSPSPLLAADPSSLHRNHLSFLQLALSPSFKSISFPSRRYIAYLLSTHHREHSMSSRMDSFVPATSCFNIHHRIFF